MEVGTSRGAHFQFGSQEGKVTSASWRPNKTKSS